MKWMSQQIWASFVGCASHFHQLRGHSDQTTLKDVEDKSLGIHAHPAIFSTVAYIVFVQRYALQFASRSFLTSAQQSHSQCSETFYRKEIEVGIKSGSSKSDEDKNKMLELLKRMEDESAADEIGLFHADEENEEDSLANRFSGIDICKSYSYPPLQTSNSLLASASTDDLLRSLSEKEKDRFFAALRDPSSGLMQELLESAELENNTQLPWWEAPSNGGRPPRIPYGAEPDLMVVPADLVNQSSRGTSLLYNICVVL